MNEERTADASPTPTPAARQDLRFIVIGAGMSGILAAIKLQEAGFDDFVVYEKADRPRRTWRENTYPGIACDVPSHFYRSPPSYGSSYQESGYDYKSRYYADPNQAVPPSAKLIIEAYKQGLKDGRKTTQE